MKNSNSKASLTGLEIAVIGMSGMFPGANDIHKFWENLKNGVESITFFSDEELLEAGIAPEMLKKPNYVKARGYIEDLQYFDASFFKYTPKEAVSMEPQLRLFHECTWHALEDAGYDPSTYNGLIGLYAGYTQNPLWKLGHLYQSGGIGSELMEIENLNTPHFTSLISYKLNLKGPAVSINTACSTSLVAVHMACRALLTGEADIILAGGVTVGVPSRSGYLYEEGMIMSPDGRCRSFDAKANGTASGGGAAMVVLKRLVKAIKDGDHVYAVIKGTAINNDGNRKAGYTALSVEAQAQVIRAAQRMAEVDPESITYIEAHGIGTPMGDPIEIEALKRAFSKTDKKQFCRIGALKPNIGHLDSAAGAASVIKTALALQHRCIPPPVNFDSPNPEIDFENSPFYVGKTREEWHSDEYPPRAGVSCFGIGGTNAHVVMEAWTEEEKRETEENRPKLILLSAKSKTALDNMTENLAAHLENNPGIDLADVAYTLQVGRQAFNYRRMLVCSSKEQAAGELLSPSHPVSESDVENPPVVFMFPGVESCYAGMGLGLYNTQPVFREEMDRCFNLLETLPDLTADNVKEIVWPGRANRANKTDRSCESYKPCAVFCLEYALGKMLLKTGIKPAVLIGDGMGEYTAACLSGVFSPESALTLLVTADSAEKDLEDRIKQLTLNKPVIPFISNITGKRITPEDAVNPRYWIARLLQTRQAGSFDDGLKELMKIENSVFLEVGPGTVLSTRVQSLPDNRPRVPVVDLVPPPDPEVPDDTYFLNGMGRLWLSGVSIDWSAFNPGEKGKRVSLPGYPFDKQYYSIDPPLRNMELKMSAGGKMPPNRPELKTAYTAPRTRVEEVLASLWEDLLGVRPIGIHDDLVELGANSLKGITFVNRFKEQWGGTIHIAAVFESPTAAELAVYVDTHYPEISARISSGIPGTGAVEGSPAKTVNRTVSQIALASAENLVFLKETSPDAGNIFFLHEVSGEVSAYVEFCRLLDTRFNCWGIQAERLKNYKPQNRATEEIAGIYVEKMRRIQPGGPYRLVTWSGGGHIAFEMALQMEQRGFPMEFLAFVDCRGPVARTSSGKSTEFTLETEKEYLRGFFAGSNVGEGLAQITDFDRIWPAVVAVLKENPSAYKEKIDEVIRADRMLTLLNFDGQRTEDLIQYMNLSRTFGNGANEYLPPRKLQIPLHFFEGTETDQSKPLFWHDYCENPVIFHHMKGDHYTIFEQPLVKDFAHVFSVFLKDLDSNEP